MNRKGRPENPIQIGERFCRLLVLEYAGRDRRGFKLVKAQCDCGKVVVTRPGNLKHGNTKSCGCYHSDKSRKLMGLMVRKKHGHALSSGSTPEYRSWNHMKVRCLNPKNKEYARYGGSGIKICDEWLDFRSFLKDMGSRPRGTTLDRIDSTGNYEPNNCRWATPTAQSRNTKRNHKIIISGAERALADVADNFLIPRRILYYRIVRQKWPVYKALNLPWGIARCTN